MRRLMISLSESAGSVEVGQAALVLGSPGGNMRGFEIGLPLMGFTSIRSGWAKADMANKDNDATVRLLIDMRTWIIPRFCTLDVNKSL